MSRHMEFESRIMTCKGQTAEGGWLSDCMAGPCLNNCLLSLSSSFFLVFSSSSKCLAIAALVDFTCVRNVVQQLARAFSKSKALLQWSTFDCNCSKVGDNAHWTLINNMQQQRVHVFNCSIPPFLGSQFWLPGLHCLPCKLANTNKQVASINYQPKQCLTTCNSLTNTTWNANCIIALFQFQQLTQQSGFSFALKVQSRKHCESTQCKARYSSCLRCPPSVPIKTHLPSCHPATPCSASSWLSSSVAAALKSSQPTRRRAKRTWTTKLFQFPNWLPVLQFQCCYKICCIRSLYGCYLLYCLRPLPTPYVLH